LLERNALWALVHPEHWRSLEAQDAEAEKLYRIGSDRPAAGPE
jgi:hypothetical protein